MAEVIVALDTATAADALALVDRLPGLRWVKVGSVLWMQEGPDVVRRLRDRGLEVFLDLKWHDIPHTVAQSAAAARELGVAMATVHALGGVAMIRAAADAAGGMRLAAVTVLTSHSAAAYGRIVSREVPDVEAEAVRLGQAAAGAGARAIVASPWEAGAIRRAVGPEPWLVTPGIRPPGTPPDDQRRTAGARQAVMAGATHLVVGRPVLCAERPAAVYSALCEEAACT